MKILVLIDGFRLGGAETLLIPFSSAAHRAGLEVDLMSVAPMSAAAPDVLDQYAAAGLAVRSLDITNLRQPGAVPRLARCIHRGGYDVVHAHLATSITLAVPAARLARRPVVASFHTLASRYEGRGRLRERLAVLVATRSDAVLFASRSSLDSYAELHYRGTAPPNWRVVHNGIDVARFRPGPVDERVRRGMSGGRTEYLAVLPAAIRKQKGIPNAIAAWKRVVGSHPGAVLALVGGGEEEAALRDEVLALGLEDSVVFTGVRSNMTEVYRAADVVVLPSLVENLPTVLIEAGAVGCPVVATTIGGIPEIVRDGVTGLLCPAADPEAMADQLLHLAGSPERRADLGSAASSHIRDEFSSETWIARLSRIYDGVSS